MGNLITPLIGTNALIARVGAANIASFALTANEFIRASDAGSLGTSLVSADSVLARVGSGDIGSLVIPAASVLVRDSTGALKTLTFTANDILATNLSGDFVALKFPEQGFIHRFAGNAIDISTMTSFAVLGKPGLGNLAPIVFLPNSILSRFGTNDIFPTAAAVQQILGRKSGDLAYHTFSDNSLLGKVGSGDWGNIAILPNTVLLRAGGDVEDLSMPPATFLLRNNTGDIVAEPFVANSLFTVNSSGAFEDRTFPARAFVTSSPTGSIDSFVPGTNRWIITNSAGDPDGIAAVLDWMLVGGPANVPTFLISAEDGIVGKFGSGATAFNVIAAESLALRGSGSLASTTIPDSNFVGRAVGGSLGAVTPAQARDMLGLQYTSLLAPIGMHVGSILLATANTTTLVYFHYMGRAGDTPPTSVNFLCRVTTAAVTITWAEVGVFTGAFVPNGNASLTRRGSADVSAIFNSTGIKNVSITGLSGISEGDDIWIAWGSQATTPFNLRATLPDDLQSGVNQTAAGQISLMAIPIATTLFSVGRRPGWVRLAI